MKNNVAEIYNNDMQTVREDLEVRKALVLADDILGPFVSFLSGQAK